MRGQMIAVVMVTVLAAAAGAQPFNGAAKLARGHYAAAEKEIVAERRAQADSVDLQLNLATLYASTGRAAQARALYQQVADAPDEQVALRNGRWASSRSLAARGLALTPATVAAR